MEDMDKARVLEILERARAEAGGRPLALDLYCCQGGIGSGLEAAGFAVIGVDISDQPRYPFTFIRADALWFLETFREWIREHVALVHGSPPCQLYSVTHRIQKNEHPDLIGPTRELMERTGVPFMLENVEDARAELIRPKLLCGTMFPGLRTYRHRLIETGGWEFQAPEHPEHVSRTVKMGRPLREGDWYHAVGNFSNVPYVRQNIRMAWASRDGIREAVPPVMAEFIGRAFLAQRAQAPELVNPFL